MLKQLVHNGIIIIEIPVPSQLTLTIRGERKQLSHRQIEMAMAWAKKQGTPYVEDATFVRNFIQDFSAELGIKPSLTVDEVNFDPAIRIVQAERAAKDKLTREERKALAAQRKAKRKELKEEYGYAIVDDEVAELGNYATEPSGIFMGRGRHPLRGKWKQGPQQSDVTLNLSPDAAPPPGDWAKIVWQPESLWVARWKDKLSGKLKYVWLSDTAPVKQKREAAKFDQALALHQNLAQVRAHIEQGLTNPNAKRRMVATACYLIDALCLRVGDEKDADEADTVGATTLRPEHVKLHPDGTGEFKFLGKDSVLWHKKIPLPPVVQQNLKKLVEKAQPSSSVNNGKRRAARDKPQLFPKIRSSDVNAYLSEVLPEITAKVFRTHHATQAVRDSLLASEVEASDPEYKKWAAVSRANLEAAVLCNHYKTAPANWKERRQRAKERLENRQERVAVYRAQVREAKNALTELRHEAREKKQDAKTGTQRKRLQVRYAKKIERAKKKIETARNRLQRAQDAQDKAKTKDGVTVKKRTWNLGTSLKSYIDPRVVYQWGQQVDYDVLERYYPKALRSKFAWVRGPEPIDDSPKNPTNG
ncbi:MAG: DNA topoisomerase I [Chloroflexi bacterium]|nr:DNA topoisomerase I [Chloroflexota bacterium]